MAAVNADCGRGDLNQDHQVSFGDICNGQLLPNPIRNDRNMDDFGFQDVTCNPNSTFQYNFEDMKSIMSDSQFEDDINFNMSILHDTTKSEFLAPQSWPQPPKFTSYSHLLRPHPMKQLTKAEMYQLISDNKGLQEYVKDLTVEKDARVAETTKWRIELRDQVRASSKRIEELRDRYQNNESKRVLAGDAVKKLERYKEQYMKMHYELKCLEAEKCTLTLQKNNAIRSNSILRLEYEKQLNKDRVEFKVTRERLEKELNDLKQDKKMQQEVNKDSNEINRLKIENEGMLDFGRIEFGMASELLKVKDLNGIMKLLCKNGKVPMFQMGNGTMLFKKKLFYSFDDILFKVNNLFLEHMDNAQIVDRMMNLTTLTAKDYFGLRRPRTLAITDLKTSSVLPRYFNPKVFILANAILQSGQRSFIQIELD